MDQEPKPSYLFILPLFLLMAINLVILDIVVFSRKEETAAIVAEQQEPAGAICDQTCRDEIIARVSERLSPKPTVTLVPTSLPATLVSQREYYIPFGSGKTKNDQWEAVAGAEAYIDTARYPNIKEVIFEAYLRLTAGVGKMHVKLYNATDGNDVWASELSSESDSTVRRETKIILASGNKLYRVLVKSTIRADAYLDNARIKIISN